MSFDWGGYVEVGRVLLQVAPDLDDAGIEEAALRASISRSYYGAFNKAFDRYRSTRESMSKTEQRENPVHAWLAQRYLEYAGASRTASPDRKTAYKRIADNLKALKELRRYADYEPPNMGDPQRKATSAQRLAVRILGDLQAHPWPPPPPPEGSPPAPR